MKLQNKHMPNPKMKRVMADALKETETGKKAHPIGGKKAEHMTQHIQGEALSPKERLALIKKAREKIGGNLVTQKPHKYG
jgi:hypothetical protein